MPVTSAAVVMLIFWSLWSLRAHSIVLALVLVALVRGTAPLIELGHSFYCCFQVTTLVPATAVASDAFYNDYTVMIITHCSKPSMLSCQCGSTTGMHAAKRLNIQ